MKYQGKIYRPWPEADSLLFQITLGCSHNKCTFCNMFREKRFAIRNMDEVLQEIEEAGSISPRIESIFLTDGNVLALKSENLITIASKITEAFPRIKRIALYAGLNDLRRKSVEELTRIREAGINMVYTGLESGDPVTLARIQKGLTPEQAMLGMENAKASGIRVLASIIFGIGGKERSTEHIEKTTRLLNVLKPEELAPMALTLQPGTKLEAEVSRGEFIQATPRQLLEEERFLLENINFPTFYWGDHNNNIVISKGNLPEMREMFLWRVNHAIENHAVVSREVHQTLPW